MNAHVVMTVMMRFILDEVKESSELKHKTLYNSVKMTDIYVLCRLDTINISKVGSEEFIF